MKYKAFIVVGYSNWGKSETLKHLVKKRNGWITINGNKFFLRKMSNSDDPESFEIFIRKMSNSDLPKSFYKFIQKKRMRNLIFAFNLDFEKDKYKVNESLNLLGKTHECFFFILKKSFNTTREPRTIKKNHIDNLKRYGIIKITESLNKKEIADEFKKFILSNIK